MINQYTCKKEINCGADVTSASRRFRCRRQGNELDDIRVKGSSIYNTKNGKAENVYFLLKHDIKKYTFFFLREIQKKNNCKCGILLQ